MKIKQYRQIMESAKPQMIIDIEQAFGLGEYTWDTGANFKPNRLHMISMFDIINKYIFENKLDRSEPKEIVDPVEHPEYRNALASFAVGQIKGAPHKLQLVRHPSMTNFFITFNAMIHEMIHFYDFTFGPMGKMINDCMIVGHLDWGMAYSGNYENGLNDAGVSTGTVDRMGKPVHTGLRKDQLPDGMPSYLGSAKQYQYPEFKPGTAEQGLRILGTRMNPDVKQKLLKHPALHPDKYELSEISMYDVHGRYFKLFAERANYMGFDVAETFNPAVKHQLRKTWENDKIENITDLITSKIKTNQYIGSKYIDDKNWFIEIQ